MTGLRSGWLVALCAAVLSISTWLPWLTTAGDGGGRANAIGGSIGSLTLPARFGVGQLIVLSASVLLVAGAMIGRGLSMKLASLAALTLSLLVAVLTAWYYRLNVESPVSAGYGLYTGVAATAGAIGCSVWALASALIARPSPARRR